MNEIANAQTFRTDGITIPDDATQEQWMEIHRTIVLCRRASRNWLKGSREWAVKRWGVDYVAGAEVQLEMQLGLPEPRPKPEPLNPTDKTKAIVTIEGITQSFTVWLRHMDAEIEQWDDDRCSRALAMLEPMVAQAARLRARIVGHHSACGAMGGES